MRSSLRRRIHLLFLFLALVAPGYPDELDSSDTYGVIVGVLQWEDPTVTSFPTADRKDRELYDTLYNLGVPESNMDLLLDEDATLENIKKSIENVCRRTKPSSTMVFYYAGHGVLDKERIHFLNYDYAQDRGLAVSEITGLLLKHFKGSRLLLFGDCCHSGGLGRVAEKVHVKGIEAVSLTSVEASNVSTTNWTFTMTLLDGLRGDPLADANGDGLVTLAEVAGEVAAAMKYCERQMFGFTRFGIEPDLCLIETKGGKGVEKELPPPYAFKEYVLAKRGERWRPARILDWREGEYAVRFQNYSDREKAWLPPEGIKKITFKRYPKGARIRVMWGGRPWDAEVIEVREDFHKITYPGWSAAWDEWILSDRIVEPGMKPDSLIEPPAGEALKKACVGGKYAKLLRKIRVERDRIQYGEFNDAGYWNVQSWGGYEGLPAGYWVYVYPHWYIWGTCTEK